MLEKEELEVEEVGSVPLQQERLKWSKKKKMGEIRRGGRRRRGGGKRETIKRGLEILRIIMRKIIFVLVGKRRRRTDPAKGLLGEKQ